jgi:hypothetical protein
MKLSAGQVLAAGGGASLLGVRLLLFSGVVLLAFAVLGLLRQLWLRRATRDEEDLPELLDPPEDPGAVLAAPLRGAYLGTADAGHWLEWFSASGLGGKEGSYISVYESGVRVDRRGKPFWIPREAVRGARFERAHAGKVAAPRRLLVIAWSMAGRELETGFRGEDRARQPKVMRSVHDLIGPPAAPTDGEITSPRPAVRSLRQLRPRRHHPDGAGQQPARAGSPTARAGHQPGRSRWPAQSLPGRGLRPRRRERPSNLEQEIADRRGADPYGTGPRAQHAPGVDPYVTGPRGVRYSPVARRPGPPAADVPRATGASPVLGAPAAPFGQAPPASRGVGVPAADPYGSTGGPPSPPPAGRPRVGGPPRPAADYPPAGHPGARHPRPGAGPPGDGEHASLPPGVDPRGGGGPPSTPARGVPTTRPPGAWPTSDDDPYALAQQTSPRAFPAPTVPPAPPSAYGPDGSYDGEPARGQGGTAGRPAAAGPRPADWYATGDQHPAPGGPADPFAVTTYPAGRASYAAGTGPWASEDGDERDPYAPARPGGLSPDDPSADRYGQYDPRRRPRPPQ